jgi:predicted secreted protein
MCIQETSDGGFIVCGEEDITSSDWDVFLMKIDSEGNVVWQKTHRFGEYGDNAYAVKETLDGGYILTGRLETDINNADFHAIKTDSNGDIEWHKSYGGPYWDQSNSNDILLAEDGGYYFLAETRSFGAGNLDIWLIKTDANGDMEWNKTFGGKKLDLCGGMDFTDDGGIIIAGTINRNSYVTPRDQGILIKTDLNGNMEWQQIFGDEKEDAFQGICSTSDGGYIVGGHTDSTDTHGAGGFDGWLIKMKAFENNPPDKPSKPSGKAEGEPGIDYTFSTSCIDLDGDDVVYLWDWGDGNFSEWLESSSALYNWSEYGDYNVKVMAKDEHGGESEWSETLKVSMPRPRFANRPVINLFQRYQNLFLMLKILLQRFTI